MLNCASSYFSFHSKWKTRCTTQSCLLGSLCSVELENPPNLGRRTVQTDTQCYSGSSFSLLCFLAIGTMPWAGSGWRERQQPGRSKCLGSVSVLFVEFSLLVPSRYTWVWCCIYHFCFVMKFHSAHPFGRVGGPGSTQFNMGSSNLIFKM